MPLIDEFQQLGIQAVIDIESAGSSEVLEALRLKYLSRKGLFSLLTTRMKELDPSQRPEAGRVMNEVKQKLERWFDEKQAKLGSSGPATKSGNDLTMPSTAKRIGGLHPLTQVQNEICDIFASLGFSIASGPEMETDRYNFEALNIPPDHPSRDGLDTFRLDNGKLLRSQTSTVQIRVMEKEKPPIKVVAPGKVYRPDATDATHSFMFHQIEGLMVDENVSFADLKGILMAFATRFFGKDVKLRFRPHFFPFTEPSAEVDVSCDVWKGMNVSATLKTDWLEILGAGLVHPNVLRAVSIDPKKYSGFAFGMGVERMAMLRWGVKDIRLFYENDMRFLRQF